MRSFSFSRFNKIVNILLHREMRRQYILRKYTERLYCKPHSFAQGILDALAIEKSDDAFDAAQLSLNQVFFVLAYLIFEFIKC